MIFAGCDLPSSTLTNALTCFVDLNFPITRGLMQNLIDFFTDEQEKANFIGISNDNAFYQTWREKNPNILDVLLSFPSIKVRSAKNTALQFYIFNHEKYCYLIGKIKFLTIKDTGKSNVKFDGCNCSLNTCCVSYVLFIGSAGD